MHPVCLDSYTIGELIVGLPIIDLLLTLSLKKQYNDVCWIKESMPYRRPMFFQDYKVKK